MTSSNRPAIPLKKVLTQSQLPALPQSAIRVLELSQDPENGPAEFAVPIESDPGLAGQVLRFVNSSYFGFSREISSIKLAISLVGIRTIKNFALWSAVFSLMPNPKCGPFDLKRLWQDSLRRAVLARAVGKLLAMKDVEETFSAALLQDMAIPLLAKEAPDLYVKLLKARRDGKVRLSELERHVFGWTHAEAAGMLCRQWNLPDGFAVLVECRQWNLPDGFAVLVESHLDIHRWIDRPDSEPGKLAVALSALLPAAADPAWTECAEFASYYEKAVPPGSPTIPELLEQLDQEFADFAPVLKLAAPSKSLLDTYNEVLAAAS